MLWQSSFYGFSLRITMEEARSASHQGQCDEDVKALSEKPRIARQLAKIDPDSLKKELKEYGAWSEEDLKDHPQNLQRILWLACGDIVEENRK